MKWLQSTLTKLWRWLFPEAKAMAYKSLLRVLAVKHSGHASNLTEGEVREVLPVNHTPSRHEKMQFLYIKSEMTEDEAKAYWLKSGVPDTILEAYAAEEARIRAEINAVIAGKKKDADADTRFNPQYRYNPEDYPSRLRYIDLTKIDQTTLGRCQAGLQAIINNRSAALTKATEKARTKYAEQLGRALTTQEEKLKIEEIKDKYKIPAGEKDKKKIDEYEQKLTEISLASAAGKHEIDYAAFDQLTEPDILEHTNAELDDITLTND